MQGFACLFWQRFAAPVPGERYNLFIEAVSSAARAARRCGAAACATTRGLKHGTTPTEEAAMETTFHLKLSPQSLTGPTAVRAMLQSVTDMICNECGGGCQGFSLTDDFRQYQSFEGPKVGWTVDGGVIFLRMANCRHVGRIERVSEILKVHGVAIVDAQHIQ
jgi:hypothetical protein